MATQHRIARWVDDTLTQPPCNAFTPATPHVQALKLKEEKKERRREERRAYYDADSDVSDDHDSRYARSAQTQTTRHRKSHSTKEVPSHRSPKKERSRERERERDRERRDYDRPRERQSARDQERASTKTYKPEKAEQKTHYDADYVWVDRDAPPPSSSTRARSSSQSASSKPRPSHNSRSHTVPHLSLDLPPMPLQRQEQYYYHDHRNSHSSVSSATTPNSGSTTHGMFPAGHVTPHSAPPITGKAPVLGGHPPKPHRSQTVPFTYNAAYPQVDKNGYPVGRPPVGSQPVVVSIRPTMNGSKSYGTAGAYAPDPSVRCLPFLSVPAH